MCSIVQYLNDQLSVWITSFLINEGNWMENVECESVPILFLFLHNFEIYDLRYHL